MPLLHELAHCRAGDKGNVATLSVFPYDEAQFSLLAREVTAERVRAHLAAYIDGEVVRHELPGLGALHFVCHQVVDGGVTTSLALDTHGKSLSSRLLSMEVGVATAALA
jgi:DNA-binding transcriptional regulator YdaS (Cro superfamily)